jgi:hypothetical protein
MVWEFTLRMLALERASTTGKYASEVDEATPPPLSSSPAGQALKTRTPLNRTAKSPEPFNIIQYLLEKRFIFL